MTTPWGEIGYITYARTYARWLDEKQTKKEEFPDTVERIIKACDKQLKVGFTPEEEQFARDMMLNLKGIVAGRFLWQLGTRTVKTLGLASLQNCATTVVNDPIRPFTWAFDMLMLGSGVGYNIQKEHVYELPRVRKAKIVRRDANDADFIVPDSREGWVRLLRYVLESHFGMGYSGGFSYSTICVRGKGAPIKGFGGTASGPEELCWGVGEISRILNSRAGKKLNPIDVLDIMNIIGAIVVAGNVRRSAQIAIGDAEDIAYMNAKRWDMGNIPNWRAMSNNSVVCNDINRLPDSFWQGYEGNGEPYGLINLDLSRRVGRLGDTNYPDPEVIGYNPCAEQSLAAYETCCLAEIYLPNIRDKEELFRVASTLYRINKHSLNLPCHHEETAEIVHRNNRMGIGITGYLQSTSEQRGWLSEIYGRLREYDVEYSRKHNWNRSIKLTTVKPSGTLSLLAGVTPGCHSGYAQHFIRRIRIASDSPLIDVCRQHGYDIEPVSNFDGTIDSSTSVVSFPCMYPEGTKLAKDMTAIDQLEVVKELQSNWSDNAVSCTVYYRQEELQNIKQWLGKNYNDSVKSVSFLLHTGHGFRQAPYEEISEDQYLEMKAKTKAITSATFNEEDMELDGCDQGHCPIK